MVPAVCAVPKRHGSGDVQEGVVVQRGGVVGTLEALGTARQPRRRLVQ